MKRRILSLLLVLCLMATFLPQIVPTASAGIHGSECGPALTWSLDENTGVLTISGTGSMYNYIGTDYQICAPWLPQKDSITHVIIEDGVTSIGTHAFNGCTNLTTVEMGNDVETIGNHAFYECSSLTDLNIGPQVEVIGEYAFAYCSSLAKLVIPGGTISSYAFGWCDALKQVDSGFIECVYDAAFIGCTSLKTFVFPPSARYIGNSIFGGSDMELVRVEADNPYYTIDEAGVLYSKDMTVLYDYFYKLPETFRVPEGVTNIEDHAFSYEEDITAIILPESLRKIGGRAFSGCTGLTKMTIPNGVTEIGLAAFWNCSGLTEVSIPATANDLPQNIFEGCTSLKKIHIDSHHPYFYSDKQGIVYYHRAETDDGAVYICPPGYTGTCTISTSVTYVDSRAFNGCSGLTEIEFLAPSLVTLDDYAFSLCENLTKVTFHSEQTAFKGESFHGCNNIQKIYFYGNAPSKYINSYTFPKSATLYYIDGAKGWTSPTWNNYPTATFLLFADVAYDAYYFDSVLWAVREGITNGTGKNAFSPENDCTRAQVVTFLWRAAGCPEPMGTENPFKDVDARAYYYDAVLWAVEQGITTGTTVETFSPETSCTRGQVVTFLWRAAGCPEPTGTKNPFKDVGANAYYYDAVLWAVEQGITNGITKDTFSPESTCTRGQIVTFLYRAFN